MNNIQKISFMNNLMNRRVPQILGVYLAGSWGIIEFMSMIVDRYQLSQNLIDLTLTIIFSSLPSVLVLSWYHGTPGPDEWTSVEKIVIPINIVTAGIIIFIFFGSKGLAAETKIVKTQDEQGQYIERIVPRSEFRKSLALFFFENKTGEPDLDWLQVGFADLVDFDLYQDQYISVHDTYTTMDELRQTGFNRLVNPPLNLMRRVGSQLHVNHFIDGEFSKQGDDYQLTIKCYVTKTGRKLAENTFTGPNIFNLVDQATVQLKKDLGIPQRHFESMIDLPVDEIMTDSQEAYENYARARMELIQNNWDKGLEYYNKSLEIDPNYTYVHFLRAEAYFNLNSPDEAFNSLDLALDNIFKLPDRLQFEIKSAYYSIIQQADKAFSVVKMWTELYPQDIRAHRTLAGKYLDMNDRGRAIKEFERIIEIDPAEINLIKEIGDLYVEMEDNDKALKYLNRYLAEAPNDFQAFMSLGKLYQSIGKFRLAKINFEKADLIEPGRMPILLSLVELNHRQGKFSTAKEQSLSALNLCRTARDSAIVYESLVNMTLSHGELKKALEYSRKWTEQLNKFDNRLNVKITTMKKLINVYLKSGYSQAALQLLAGIEEGLPRPFNQFAHLGYMQVYMELQNDSLLEKSIQKVQELNENFQNATLRPAILKAQGHLAEMRHQYSGAMIKFQRADDLNPAVLENRVNQARLERKMENYERSLEILEELLIKQPYSADIHVEMAQNYQALGQKTDALQHYETALMVWENADPIFLPVKQVKVKMAELRNIS